MSLGEALPPRLDRLRTPALLVGAVGLIVALAGCLIMPGRALPAYLVGFLFWFGIGFGGLALSMLHRLVGGSWGLIVRRPMEAASLTMPLLALLFVPIFLGLATLYPEWAVKPEKVHELSQAVKHKLGYLNANFFLLRAGLCFASWTVLAYLMSRWSVRQDSTPNPAASRWPQMIAAPGLVWIFLSGTVATIDWVMSLEPDWYSTIYSVMLMIGMGLSTLAFTLVLTTTLTREGVEPTASAGTPGRFNDLGNLTLAFTMLWAYTSFSQFLLIWCGNLIEEIPYYLRRSRGGWQVVVAVLMGFHFFAPFFFLLMKDVKRGLTQLRTVALFILFMRVVDLSWLVLPAQAVVTGHDSTANPNAPGIPWLTLPFVLASVVGIGGVWFSVFLRNLGGKSLVPLNDPGIDVHAEADHGGGH